VEFPNIYATAMQSSGFTASTLIGFDSSKNLVSSKIPLTPSYGTCYANVYTRITPSVNTWTLFGAIWSAGACSSDWTINTSVANRGLKYTGANALVQITYSAQTTSYVNANFSLGIGSGTPVPVENPNSTGMSIRTCYNVVNDGDYSMVYSSFLANVNTNDSIIFYAALNSPSTTCDVVSGNIQALVLEYL
jgi:GH43 family beta-xylosidase